MCLRWILFIYDYWQPAKLIENSSFLPFTLALTWPIFMRIILTLAVVMCGHRLTDYILIVYTHLMMVYLSIVCVLFRLCSYITNCTTFITLSQVNRTSVNVCLIKGAPPFWSALNRKVTHIGRLSWSTTFPCGQSSCPISCCYYTH